MENVSLTSRIVGAIVVLSLGIIFIPVLLETNQIDTGSMKESPIPDIPSEISTIVFQLNEETGKFEEQGITEQEKFEQQVANEIESSAQEIEIPEPEPPPAITTSEDKPAPVRQSTEHTWMLQVASFKDHSKAVALRDKLRKQQYPTHLDERKQDAGSIWRVRIGPDFNRSNIEKIQASLEKEIGMRGLIIRRR